MEPRIIPLGDVDEAFAWLEKAYPTTIISGVL
jgi:hypothetical protein